MTPPPPPRQKMVKFNLSFPPSHSLPLLLIHIPTPCRHFSPFPSSVSPWPCPGMAGHSSLWAWTFSPSVLPPVAGAARKTGDRRSTPRCRRCMDPEYPERPNPAAADRGRLDLEQKVTLRTWCMRS